MIILYQHNTVPKPLERRRKAMDITQVIVAQVNLPRGFAVDEADDHTVNLYYGEELVASFSASGCKPEEIASAARDYIDRTG